MHVLFPVAWFAETYSMQLKCVNMHGSVLALSVQKVVQLE